MQVLIIVLFGAFSVYLILNILLSSTGKEIVRSRISKYFKENSADDVQEQFIREKNEEEHKKKKNRIKLVSKDFSNYINASGLKLTGAEYIYLWAGLTLIPMTVIILLGGNVLTGLAFGVLGFAIPPILVARARKKRGELFNKQLSEALVIMGNSIKGGFTFFQSMESVAEDMQPPISTEFAKVMREIHYGVSQEDSLKHMVERTQNKDLELLVSAVVTSMQVGSNLTDILDTISETIRDRIKIKQEINTLTAQGRISGLVIGALPLVLVLAIMIMNPEYYGGFFQSTIGKILIVISVTMELMGFLIIKKIIDIKM
ncbi:MAG: type II secretion system F family protein [Sedimentibacter saalensis]|uniref:type II secretion system F family protein n=1 Tax=Sedimentibacter saalensis TaxID=130788 RepID=UPI003158FF0F